MSKETLVQVRVTRENQLFLNQLKAVAMVNGYHYKPDRVNFAITMLRELHEAGKFEIKDFIK